MGADLPTSSSSTTFAIGSLSLAESLEVPASATGTDPFEGLGMPPASKRPRGISGAGVAEPKGKPRLRGVAQVTPYTPVEERKSQAPDSSSVLRSTRQSTHLNGASKAPVERRSKVRNPSIVGDCLELSLLHLSFADPSQTPRVVETSLLRSLRRLVPGSGHVPSTLISPHVSHRNSRAESFLGRRPLSGRAFGGRQLDLWRHENLGTGDTHVEQVSLQGGDRRDGSAAQGGDQGECRGMLARREVLVRDGRLRQGSSLAVLTLSPWSDDSFSSSRPSERSLKHALSIRIA